MLLGILLLRKMSIKLALKENKKKAYGSTLKEKTEWLQ